MEILDQKNKEQLETAKKIVEFYRTHGRPKRIKKPETDDEKKEDVLGAWIQRHNTKYGIAQEFLDKELGQQWRGTKEVKLACLKKEVRNTKKRKTTEERTDDVEVIYYGSLSDSFRYRCPWFLRTTVQIPPIQVREEVVQKKKRQKKSDIAVKPELKTEVKEEQHKKPKKLKVRQDSGIVYNTHKEEHNNGT